MEKFYSSKTLLKLAGGLGEMHPPHLPWIRHCLAGFPHLGVVDRWPATPKQARYSVLVAFL